jgi:RNA-binding protein
MPSGKLRKTLRAAGHHLDPVVQIGKEGMTEAVLRELDAQLLAHELVKVKVGTESPEDRFEVADRLAADSGAQVAQVLGRTVLVYRRHPEKPRFEPNPVPAAPAREPQPARKPAARKPSAWKPAARQPAARKPGAWKPAASKPGARKPGAWKPAARKPGAGPRRPPPKPRSGSSRGPRR